MKIDRVLSLGISMAVLGSTAIVSKEKASVRKAETIAIEKPASLWRDPTDISARNLFYGPGGKEHEPHGPTTFIKEDLDGTNPKMVVHDQAGIKWKVKMGPEARPETAATRLIWAVGYFANEEYFVHRMLVQSLPTHLHRGQKYISSDGDGVTTDSANLSFK